MVKKKSQKSTTQTTEKKEKRAYRKKTQAIPFLPVTEEGHELTPINLKDIPDTIGGILQQTRLKKHLKLSTIAKKLCIREEFLDALEKDNYDIFPALVYGTGFLRTYANFLELNADELIYRFKNETTDVKSTPLDMPRTHDPKIMPTPKVILKSLAILIILYLIWTIFRIMTYTPFPDIQISEIAQKPVENISAPIVSDEIIPLPEKEISEDEPSEPDEQLQPQAEIKTQPTTEEKKANIYGWAEPHRISLIATGKTKIKVINTDNNQVILNHFLEEGDRYNPPKKSESFVLKASNGGALDLYIDGKMIRTLGEKEKEITDIQLDVDVLMKD